MVWYGVQYYGGRKKKTINENVKMTHAAGQILVRTNRVILRSSPGGLDWNTFVKLKPTSRAIYVVATKKHNEKKWNG